MDSDNESFYWVKKQEFSREKKRYSRMDVSGETPIDPKNMDSLVDNIMGNKKKSSMTRAAILDKDQSDDSSDDPIFKKAVKPKGKGQLAIKDAPSERKTKKGKFAMKVAKKKKNKKGESEEENKEEDAEVDPLTKAKNAAKGQEGKLVKAIHECTEWQNGLHGNRKARSIFDSVKEPRTEPS